MANWSGYQTIAKLDCFMYKKLQKVFLNTLRRLGSFENWKSLLLLAIQKLDTNMSSY
jgi:hypothetical protein